MAAKKAQPVAAKSSFTAKSIKADGWLLHDNTNPSSYDSKQYEQLRKKLDLDMRTTRSQGTKLCFESVGKYRKMLGLNVPDESTYHWLRQDVWEGHFTCSTDTNLMV